MKVIFLGTNGWFDSKTGNTVCTLIQTKACNIILDAGMGLVKADKYLDDSLPTYVFLSHLHLDHISGLHALAKFKFSQGITLFIAKQLKPGLLEYLNQPFTMAVKRLPFKLNIVNSKPNFNIKNMNIKARELIHASVCLGYRFCFGKKVISYCTDTGLCENAFYLADKADLLITECALRYGQDDQGWPHLDPAKAASLAKQAKVKKLVMTHFDADNYQTLKSRKIAQLQARKVFKESIVAFDELKIEI
ncbi:MAG: ribonuclease Z [Candidatus Omnitrophica bacterium]|nr:ribonuclease Z [Candidatus Omnitrophota bacterium]